MKTKKTKKKQIADYKKKLEANSRYNKATYKGYAFRLNIESEADLIKWLDGIEDKKAYFTRLIRLDQKREARRQREQQAMKERQEHAGL